MPRGLSGGLSALSGWSWWRLSPWLHPFSAPAAEAAANEMVQSVFSASSYPRDFLSPQLNSDKSRVACVPLVPPGFCQFLFGNRAADVGEWMHYIRLKHPYVRDGCWAEQHSSWTVGTRGIATSKEAGEE
jgi:hypothetical protein